MVTRQPIKGRRRGGGVRFGEMERDGLLSHGSIFLLQDRLFHGSDKTKVKVCVKCGSLLSPRVSFPSMKATSAAETQRFREHKAACVVCKDQGIVRDLAVPYVFLHLVSQLAAVNIKIKVSTKYE
jgi:DNA-directed RNA polymerase I subunit RPA2